MDLKEERVRISNIEFFVMLHYLNKCPALSELLTYPKIRTQVI